MRATAHTSFYTTEGTASVLDAVRRIGAKAAGIEGPVIDERSVVFTRRAAVFAHPQRVRVVAAPVGAGSDVRIVLEGRASRRTPTSGVRRAAARLSRRIQLALR